jgi:hypothetical protein
LVVCPSVRGLGIGNFVVESICSLLKDPPARLHYLYLIPAAKGGVRLNKFYDKLDFRTVSEGEEVAQGTAASGLGEDGVESLNELLVKRLQGRGGPPPLDGPRREEDLDAAAPSVLQPPQPPEAPLRWMRRRLNSRTYESCEMKVEHLRLAMATSSRHLPALMGSDWRFRCCPDRGFGLVFEQQVGPSCGVGALRMALSVPSMHIPPASFLENPGKDDLEEIAPLEYPQNFFNTESLLSLSAALSLSSDGEFFSALNLARLASTFLSSTHKVYLSRRFPSPSLLSSLLAQGCSVLLPFDRVGARAGTREGKAAHWGVISGTFVKAGAAAAGVEGSPAREEVLVKGVEGEVPTVVRWTAEEGGSGGGEEAKEGGLLLYVQHSQALLPFVETYEAIRESNGQLRSAGRRFAGEIMDLRLRVVILRRLR